MIIGFIILLAFLLIMLGYWLFTQKTCYVQHTALLHCPPEKLFDELSKLASWNDWLPWCLYDDNSSFSANHHSNNSLEQALIQLKGPSLGTISCHIQTCNIPKELTFEITADNYYPCPVAVKILVAETPRSELELVVQTQAELGFWQRLLQKSLLEKLSGDMRLMLVRLKAQAETNSHGTMSFEVLAKQKLKNFDAVTRPFIVSNQPMSRKMEQGFRDLFMTLGPDNPPAGASFAVYEAASSHHHYFAGKLGIPIQCLTPCEAQPERISFKGQYIGLRYQGSYHHLGLAWHVLKTRAQLHGLKRIIGRTSVEIYETSPRHTTDELKFVTAIYLPIR